MAVVFGGRPDITGSQRTVRHYDIIVTASARPRREETMMKNHFEGATPEALAKALLRPVRKPKAKPARRIVRPVTAKAVPVAK